MARLRHGALKLRGNPAWALSTGASAMCECGMGPETCDHFWFDCVMHCSQRRKRDLRVSAAHGHDPPPARTRTHGYFSHCPLSTRKQNNTR